MTLRLYMDHHVPRAITLGLRLRGIDVITAFDDGAAELPDPELLDRATELDRVLFSMDDDLLVEAESRLRASTTFAGLVYAHPMRVTIGDCVRDLELIATAGRDDELKNQVVFLPL